MLDSAVATMIWLMTAIRSIAHPEPMPDEEPVTRIAPASLHLRFFREGLNTISFLLKWKSMMIRATK